MTRELLPNRRASWTQKVRIDGNTYYLSCGEYPDGRIGEIFIEAHKEGTFARGVLSAVARLVSISLQSGVPVDQVVRAMRHLNFPPRGDVEGSEGVKHCTSVCDWIAQEIEHAYCRPEDKPARPDTETPVEQIASPPSIPDLGTTTESQF